MTQAAAERRIDASWAKLEEFIRLTHKLQAAIRVDLGIGPP
jgi:hypothetical protein